MKSESPDVILAGLFEEQRRADEAAAPELARLLAEPRRRPEAGARAVRLAFVAVGFAATVAAALLILRPAGRRGLAPETAAIQLADWKAPTDAFLETSGAELWSRVPVLLPREAAFEAPIVTEPTKGVTP